MNLKNYVDAEKDALSALRLDNAHVKSLFRYGTALYYLRQYKQAKMEFSNLLRVDPRNKNGQEYLRHTEQKLAKIKIEAYEKLYLGEIVGGSTGIGKSIIKVQEINIDKKEAENIPEKIEFKEEDKSEEIKEEVKEERESKTELLSKTDVSNIKRDKGEDKSINEFIENPEEQEELRRLEEERKNNQRKKGKKKNRKRGKGKKNKNKETPIEPEEAKDIVPNPIKILENSKNNTKAEPEKSPVQSTKLEIIKEAEVQKVIGNKPKINFAFGSDDLIETEGEEQDSPTNGEGTPEQFKNNSSEESKINLSLQSEDGINLANGHEIRKERDTSPVQKQIKEECDKIKDNIPYDSEEEDLDVVKSEEGKFYSIRYQKPASVKPILKKAGSEVLSDRTIGVSFELTENEIKDFKKNDKLNLRILNQQLSGKNFKKAQKKPKKRKGKGKRRNQGKNLGLD